MFLIHGQAGRSIASHAGVFRGARFSSLPGKFCPGISFTICTNQFNVPKNDREGIKDGFEEMDHEFPFGYSVRKNRKIFSDVPLLPEIF